LDFVKLGDRYPSLTEASPVRIKAIIWKPGSGAGAPLKGQPEFQIKVATKDDAGNSYPLSATWTLKTNAIIQALSQAFALQKGIINQGECIQFVDEHINSWISSSWYSILSFNISEITKYNDWTNFQQNVKEAFKPDNITASAEAIASGTFALPMLRFIVSSFPVQRMKSTDLGDIYLEYYAPANGISSNRTNRGEVRLIFGTEEGWYNEEEFMIFAKSWLEQNPVFGKYGLSGWIFDILFN
jgi:hypothetical protein